MAGVVSSNNVEEEYLWSCTLSGATKEFSWAPEDPADSKEDDEADPSVKPGHRLLIKTAILMPSAKKDEVTVVQIEGEGYNKSKVVVPICAMKAGHDFQQYVDLLIPCPAKLVLLQGEGPIHFVGSHCVDFYGYRDTGAGDDSEEEDNTEDDADMEEAEELVKDAKEAGDKENISSKGEGQKGKNTPDKDEGKKRKASEEQTKSTEKKKKESPSK